MSTTRRLPAKIMVFSGAVVLALLSGSQWWIVKLRQDRANLFAEIAATEKLMASAKLERDVAIEKSEKAKEEISKLAQARLSPHPDREAEMKVWLARVKQLKQLFALQPDQDIPEIHLLTDRDWLFIGKTVELGSGGQNREAMASVRNAARAAFVGQLAGALQKYQMLTHGEYPPTLLALSPYFSHAVDSAVLERYAILESGKVKPGQPTSVPVIIEKSAIDPDFDDRIGVYPWGGWTTGNPLDWIPDFQEKSNCAYDDYLRANHETPPPDRASLIPYFKPALDSATAEKLRRIDRQFMR